jgi:hypothetical protein
MPLLDHFSPRRSPRSSLPLSACQQINTLWDLGLVYEALLDLPADQWPGSLSHRGAQTGTGSQSTRQYFKKLGIAPRSVFIQPRTRNDNLRIDALFGTFKSQPVYPGYFAGAPPR